MAKKTRKPAKRKKIMRAPVDRIERWSVDRLKPYLRNPRLHSPEQIDQIAASMKAFGQSQLIIVDPSGEIIAGHGRLTAAIKLGWPQVIVGIAIGWSEKQKRAYRIADNKIALGSTWDDHLLKTEAMGLGNIDFNVLGFDAKEWASLLSGPLPADASPQLANLSFAVIVRCDDELHQKAVIEQLAASGLRVEALIS